MESASPSPLSRSDTRPSSRQRHLGEYLGEYLGGDDPAIISAVLCAQRAPASFFRGYVKADLRAHGVAHAAVVDSATLALFAHRSAVNYYVVVQLR